jgi:hypothetical protein
MSFLSGIGESIGRVPGEAGVAVNHALGIGIGRAHFVPIEDEPARAEDDQAHDDGREGDPHAG